MSQQSNEATSDHILPGLIWKNLNGPRGGLAVVVMRRNAALSGTSRGACYARPQGSREARPPGTTSL